MSFVTVRKNYIVGALVKQFINYMIVTGGGSKALKSNPGHRLHHRLESER
jgi:hypothetical protein